MNKNNEEVKVCFGSKLIKGRFCSRPNRFLAYVDIEGEEVATHVADPGRLKELLVPGADVYLLPREGENRKTRWQLVLVKNASVLVSVYSQLPNRLAYVALNNGKISEFADFPHVKAEYTIGNSRFDFALAKKNEDPFKPDCLVEVKSVTLVENGVALFPDAPTKRGVKHVNELIRLKQSGYNAAVLFIVQRSDAKKVSPNRKTDPQFAKALAKAKSVGVKIVAYGSRLDTGGITLLESVPVVL